jgi:hypothetical protein
VVAEEQGEGLGVDALDGLAVLVAEAAQEVLDEQGDVLAAVAQGGDASWMTLRRK